METLSLEEENIIKNNKSFEIRKRTKWHCN